MKTYLGHSTITERQKDRFTSAAPHHNFATTFGAIIIVITITIIIIVAIIIVVIVMIIIIIIITIIIVVISVVHQHGKSSISNISPL